MLAIAPGVRPGARRAASPPPSLIAKRAAGTVVPTTGNTARAAGNIVQAVRNGARTARDTARPGSRQRQLRAERHGQRLGALTPARRGQSPIPLASPPRTGEGEREGKPPARRAAETAGVGFSMNER